MKSSKDDVRRGSGKIGLSDECELVSVKHGIAAIKRHQIVATQQELRHVEL